jgi:hypothetical protein
MGEGKEWQEFAQRTAPPTRWIDGKRAYNLGIDCQTCSLLFERLPGANQSVEIKKTADTLRSGVATLSDPVILTVGSGLPEGEYVVMMGEASLRFVYPQGKGDYFCEEQMALWGEDKFWCLPHDPRIPYFRVGELNIGEPKSLETDPASKLLAWSAALTSSEV